jgi:hypothetical protein
VTKLKTDAHDFRDELWKMTHPILEKLGIKFEDLTIQPRDINDLDKMVFIKNEITWPVRIMVESSDFYVMPNAVENCHIKGDEATIRGVVEIHEFKKTVKQGEIVTISAEGVTWSS